MNLIYAAGIAAVMGCGLHLMLSRHVIRIMFGIMLISASVNLAFFLAGTIGPNPPPVMLVGETVLDPSAANPLPQALVLTAIVISFSLVAFFVALALQMWRRFGTLDTRKLNAADRMGSRKKGKKKR